jgi:hypothetical protein
LVLAAEIAERQHRIDLGTALRFLPLIAKESPREFDAWACRWLARWLAETPTATIERAADLALARVGISAARPAPSPPVRDG